MPPLVEQWHLLRRLVATVACAGFLYGGSAAVLTRGPYLQSAAPNSLVVKWRTDVPTDSRVVFGDELENLGLSAATAASTTEHSLVLADLQPHTRYFYSVGTSQELLASGPDYFFVTPPESATSTRIWVIGDSGTASQMARAVRDGYASFARGRYTDLWLMLGDNAYPFGSDSSYQAAVFDNYPALLRQTVLWPTIGNHDFDPAYFNIFTLPVNGSCGGIASGTESYYSFDYGDIHFVCLNSQKEDRSSDAPMLTWLREDLESTTKNWVIAFWHHPPYSHGHHNSDGEIELVEMRQYAVPILEAHGVDLVLSGHSHSYERSFLLHGHYGMSQTLTTEMIRDGGDGRADGSGAYAKSASSMGAVYAVAGSSGQITPSRLDHPAMFRSLGKLGSMVLDIDRNRLLAIFLRETGEIDDYFTIAKSPPPLAPVIVHHPIDRTVEIASSVNSTVIAEGAPPLRYQWFHDGAAIDGADRPQLLLSNVNLSASGRYAVVVTNLHGTATSAVARIVVVARPPSIVSEPADRVVASGSPVWLGVSATGTPPLRYQWWHDESSLPDATSSAVFLGAVTTNDAGGYFVVVTNEFGSVTSRVATLTVETPSPTIAVHPASQTACPGGFVLFSVLASGVGPLRYQWLRNQTNLTGAAGSELFFQSVTAADAAAYSVVVMNDFDAVTSRVATLTILADLPVIGEEPTDLQVVEGETAYFGVVASSICSPLTYQWRLNDRRIPGATEPGLVITLVSSNDVGAYSVVVSTSFGSVTSAVVQLTLLPPPAPFFERHPMSQMVGGGTDVVLEPIVYPELLSFQWLLNGKPIPGATNKLLVLPNATTNQSGDYVVVAANSSGTETSSPATVIVKPAGPLDRWTWRRPLPQGNDLASIAHGNDIFVAVGTKGALLSSHNGLTWQVRSQGQTDFTQVLCARGVFVAIGNHGIVSTSTDGVAWTRRGIAPNSLLSVAYGDGRFVAGVAGHRLAFSPDGAEWTVHPSGLTADLYSLTFGGSQFLGFVDRFKLNDDFLQGTVAFSTNGVHWTQEWFSETERYDHLVFLNNRFLAFEQGEAVGYPPRVVISTNGREWLASRLWFGGGYPAATVYANGRYIGVGHDYNYPNPTKYEAVFFSTNAIDWTALPTGAPGTLAGLAYDGQRLVAVGPQGRLLVSTDAEQWTRTSPASAISIRGVAFGQGNYVAVGDAGLVLTSPDGETWTEQPSGTLANLQAVTFAAGRFAAVGADDFGGVILASENGLDWARVPATNFPALSSIVYGAGLFLAVGNGGAVVTSSDGEAWNLGTDSTGSHRNAVAYGMDQFVAVGCGSIETSRDGAVWNTKNAPCLRGVAVGTNLIVAVGWEGTVLTSSDGRSWTYHQIDPPGISDPHENFEVVIDAGGMFITVSDKGRLYSSTDGSQWVRHETVSAHALRHLTFANGTLLAVGDNQTIVESGYFASAFLRVRPPVTAEGFEFSVGAEPGRIYVLQGSTDLVAWADLLTFSNTQELTVFLDTQASLLPRRFYRVRSP